MGIPQYVPVAPDEVVRSYGSPPRRPRPWLAHRPAEICGRQPVGEGLGTPGPDHGYALSLAKAFEGRLTLHRDEREIDALSGASAVAMKRSGLLGRGPILDDVRAGLSVWGFLTDADPALVELRRVWFEEIHHPHDYMRRRRVADAVPASLLRQSLEDIEVAVAEDWRACLDLQA